MGSRYAHWKPLIGTECIRQTKWVRTNWIRLGYENKRVKEKMKRKERLGEIGAQWDALWKWIGLCCLAHLSVIHTQFELELQLSPRRPLNHRNNLFSAYPTISWTRHSLWFPHHRWSVALTMFYLHNRMNCSSWEKHCHLCCAASVALRLL